MWSAVGSGGFRESGRSVGSGGEVCGKAKKRKAVRGSGTRKASQDREARAPAAPGTAGLGAVWRGLARLGVMTSVAASSDAAVLGPTDGGPPAAGDLGVSR
jgi:hypothetical protein